MLIFNKKCGRFLIVINYDSCLRYKGVFINKSVLRERPFNLKGGGGYGFFSKKNILIPNVAEKNILILVEEKKNNLIQSSCHIT